MDAKIEKLRDWGCDIAGALERMLNDEEFYLECLQEIPGDPCFGNLRKALEEKDTKTAFDCAHTLKGVLSNVGLTPMYKQTVEIVEPLRAGQCSSDLTGEFDKLEEMRAHLAEILES